MGTRRCGIKQFLIIKTVSALSRSSLIIGGYRAHLIPAPAERRTTESKSHDEANMDRNPGLPDKVLLGPRNLVSCLWSLKGFRLKESRSFRIFLATIALESRQSSIPQPMWKSTLL